MTAESDQIGRVFAGGMRWAPTIFARCCTSWSPSAGAPLTAGDLRQRMGVSGAAITYLVERMIASGHLRRESDPADRRKVILRYADHGMHVARAFFTPLADAHPRGAGRATRRGSGRRTSGVRCGDRCDAGVQR